MMSYIIIVHIVMYDVIHNYNNYLHNTRQKVVTVKNSEKLHDTNSIYLYVHIYSNNYFYVLVLTSPWLKVFYIIHITSKLYSYVAS